jgi:hypothetical protein
MSDASANSHGWQVALVVSAYPEIIMHILAISIRVTGGGSLRKSENDLISVG